MFYSIFGDLFLVEPALGCNRNYIVRIKLRRATLKIPAEKRVLDICNCVETKRVCVHVFLHELGFRFLMLVLQVFTCLRFGQFVAFNHFFRLLPDLFGCLVKRNLFQVDAVALLSHQVIVLLDLKVHFGLLGCSLLLVFHLGLRNLSTNLSKLLLVLHLPLLNPDR